MLSSGGEGGRHTSSAVSLSKSLLLYSLGLAQVVVEKGAWWPEAFQQGGLCAGQEQGGRKSLLGTDFPVFGQPHQQAQGVLGQGCPTQLEHRISPVSPGVFRLRVDTSLCRKGPHDGEQVFRSQPQRESQGQQDTLRATEA